MRAFFLVALCLSACAAGPEFTKSRDSQLTFIHLNDTYRVGAVEDGTRGGFGRVVTVIRELQSSGREVRILHAGDFLYPSLESQLWHGEQMIEAFNYLDDLAPLYAVAGNHEFDPRQPDRLADAVRASRFDWLGDNYRFRTGNPQVDAALARRFVFEQGGKRVGVFSLTLGPDDGGNARDYAPVDADYLGEARRALRDLEADGVDVIIGLTHLHLVDDIELARLRSEHPKLAFIAGGHEHDPQYVAAMPGRAPVIKGASNARVIWRIDVTFDAAGLPVAKPERLEMDERVAIDPDYARIPAKWRARLLELYPFLEARIGEAALEMDATEQTIRSRETSWGNFIADQMRGAFGAPPAALAFINSGTLRIDDTIAGDIVFEDIARTFGFSSLLRILPISGAEFRALLEAGYRGGGEAQGYFPQVSGFRVCVDRSRPAWNRIVSLQVPAGDRGWEEIQADREYLLVMPDFLFRGGDGYRVPGHRKAEASRPGSELKYLVFDAVISAQAVGRSVGEPVDPHNPRYVELGPQHQACWHAPTTNRPGERAVPATKKKGGPEAAPLAS